jgi:GNAT superfamily N-acetyltransferase
VSDVDSPLRLVPVDDAAWLDAFLRERWGAPGVISRGRLWRAGELSAMKAMDGTGLAGVASWHCGPNAMELVTIDALRPFNGIGSALLSALVETARRRKVSRLWVVTTNDNLDALRFYQRRGWRLAALRCGAIAEGRRLKPAIPETGGYGIPIRDEIELEYPL